ncbi:MAG: relaxase/mobilization nuclease domain-containing protein, partial [Clostridiaceae bacterium]|nr:relaxase/mobilization nuclease domain-containing protein [Clostridiaceae bacterium]
MPTATTYLKKHKISKGETIAQSLKDRFEYGQNPDKTQGGELISSYACDHMTADAEFLLSKAKYRAVTGREQRRDADVLCYQIRQAFKPGEITPEEANRIGYETAMRWTKGKYAFFVATHTDRQHIHNHIYYNSTSLDCTRKFRDFIGSARAVRRLSDRVCLENDLSVILNPKLHSKGRFLHYGAWLGAERQPSYKERLRLAINDALAKGPADFADFLRLMAESGYAVKHGRGGVISFLVPGQERATRLRASTLGEGYDPENIRAVIAGERPIPEIPKDGPAPPRRVNLIIDIQERMAQGKGPAYARWAKVYNLKQMAAALQYLQEHKLTNYEELAASTEAAVDRFHALAGELRETEAALSHTVQLMGATVDFAKTRPVFDGYKAARYSRKYLAQHEAELAAYRAAKAAMND